MIYTQVMVLKRGVIKERKSTENHFVEKQTQDNGNNICNKQAVAAGAGEKLRKTKGKLGVK